MENCTTKQDPDIERTIRDVLGSFRRIAVVGVSDKPWRPSYRIARYLLEQGYEVLPVNPGLKEFLGRRCYPDLAAAPGPVEVVDIFRRPEHIPGIVEAAIAAGARAVWMQSGLRDDSSAARARQAGLRVVMDRCIMVEHRRLATGNGSPRGGGNEPK